MTEQSDLGRMVLAARQIGEVTGEDLFSDLRLETTPVELLCPSIGKAETRWVPLFDEDALDLLTARVLGALWKWSRSMKAKRTNRNDMSGNVVVAEHGIGIHWTPRDVFGTGYKDLPSAVAAIHKHWKATRTAGEALPKILNKIADDLENHNV